jgi:hypothetical protein
MRINHAEVNARDVYELTLCLDRLNQIHDSVNATGMAGKLAVMRLCVEVYRVIEGLLRKEQRAVEFWQLRVTKAAAAKDGQGEA